jgi:hypothetical protein
MRRYRGAPLLLALAVAFGAVAAGCEGDDTVIEDDEGTLEDDGDEGDGGEDGSGDGESGDGGGGDAEVDVDY